MPSNRIPPDNILTRWVKPGEPAPLPPVIQHRNKAAELRAKNTELDRRAIELQEQIDSLAYRVIEEADTEAVAEVQRLKAERDNLSDLKRMNDCAAREHDKKAEVAADADVKRRRVARYKEIRSVSGTRYKNAERAVEALDNFAAAIAKIAEANEKMTMMVAADESRAGTGTYRETFMYAVAHAMLVAGQNYGFTMPGGRYSSDYKDFVGFIRSAHEATAERFSENAARGVRSVAECAAAANRVEVLNPTGAAVQYEPTPMAPVTDTQIEAEILELEAKVNVLHEEGVRIARAKAQNNPHAVARSKEITAEMFRLWGTIGGKKAAMNRAREQSGQPKKWTDEEIAEANEKGTAKELGWPLSAGAFADLTSEPKSIPNINAFREEI